MEPITIILSALAAGASMVASGSLGEAGSDAYNKIKESIKKRLAKKESGEFILTKYEKNPEIWEKPLMEYLTELAIDRDKEIIELAKQVREQAGDSYQFTFSGPIAIGTQPKAADVIIENFYGTTYQGPPPEDEAEALQIYRRQILSSCQHLPLRGIDIGLADPKSGRKQMGLAQIYVELNTKTQVSKDKRRKSKSKELEPEREEKESRPLPALEATVNNRKLVLLGDPGSGKSTFLAHLAFCLAASGLGDKKQHADFLPGWKRNENTLLPVQVLLRDFARQAPLKENGDEPRHLLHFIQKRLEANNLKQVEEPLTSALETGQAIVMLDGLDEVPDKAQRTFVKDAVKAFAKRYARCRFVVTCRTLSYEDSDWQLDNFPVFELAPFNEKQIDQFIHAWYDELVRLGSVKSETDSTVLTSKLQQAVRKQDMWRLASNPLLLTVMALVHTHKGRLPEARALLYEETIDILLWRWEQIKISGEDEAPELRQLLLEAGRSEVDLKKILWELAFEAHGKGSAGDDENVLADIDELRLEKAIANLKDNDRNWALHVIETMKLRAGLLLERSPGIFTFPHRTFQEYLAGAYLSSRAKFAENASMLVEQGALWREVILLAVGRLVYLSGDTDKPLALVYELCPDNIEEDELGWRKVWLAGDALLEMGLERVNDTNLGRDRLPCVRERLAQLVSQGKLHPVERAAAGRTLAKLGDPRPGVGVYLREKTELPDILWCHIPAGKFWMGSDKQADKDANDDESPRHELTLPEFYISRYPVTQAQFMAFVKNGGYGEQRYWHEAEQAEVWVDGKVQGPFDSEARSQPAGFGGVFQLPNHPVVGVTWYEALAFCRWLEEQLFQQENHFEVPMWQQDSIIQQQLATKSYRLILPSEAQWEKAARGNDGRTFPWGDEADPNCANYADSGIGTTSTVGCFPAGETPFGALDMSGNVLEWTRSLWGNKVGKADFQYPYKAEDGLENLDADRNVLRILRGGAFINESRYVRCADRDRDNPNYGDWNIGFRVVLSPDF